MLCVIAKLDERSSARLNMIRGAAGRFGIGPKPVYGHITLAAYTGGDEKGFISACKEILGHFEPFEVLYERIDVLEATSIIVASPKNEGALDSIHREIAAAFENELDVWTRGSAWRPHTTLLYKPGTDLYPIARAMSEDFEPFPAQVQKVEFSLAEDSEYEIIDRITL